MNTTNAETSFSDCEESFIGYKHRKPRSGAILDSDSDETEENSLTNHLTEDSDASSVVDDSENYETIEDSFEEEDANAEATTGRDLSPKISAFTDDEEEASNFSEDEDKEVLVAQKEIADVDKTVHDSNIISEDEIVDSSDIEDHSPGLKMSFNYKSFENNTEVCQSTILGEAEEINSDREGKEDKEEDVAYASESDDSEPVLKSIVHDKDIENSDANLVEQIANFSSANDCTNIATEAPSEGSNDLVEIVENSVSVLELSSDEEDIPATSLKQTNIKEFLTQPVLHKTLTASKEPFGIKKVTGRAEYEAQLKKVRSIEADLLRTQNAMRVIKLENLPDKGKSLVEKAQSLNIILQDQRNILANMIVEDKPPITAHNKIEIAWEEIEAGVDAVGPRTLGKKGVAQFNLERNMAVETLDSLHKSLETCPTENDFVEDPKGLKVPLMPHQKRALAWLLWREKQKPSGGLLADDMGLGKTLTMISFVLKSREVYPDEESDKENYRDKYPGGTLVVCPASLINQWSGEIGRRTKRGLLSVEVHHGAKRETKSKRLAAHDFVITTYTIILNENDKKGVLFGVRWRRIILDEAHQIRNYKSRTSEAVCQLSGKSRWALTGTPVHNKELDMYALLKFLRCSPFDDLRVWKHWVGDKSTGGQMRLHAVISSLMLRRTKTELMEKGALQSLPDRSWELIPVSLEKDEMDVYQKVLIFSRTLFAQFLHQRAEKNQDMINLKFSTAPPDPNGEYFKMRNKLLKLNRVKEVSQHEILVLLLRLRQICCHPFLIKQMLHGDEDLGDAEDQEESEEMNLLEQLNRLDINAEDDHPAAGLSDGNVGLKEASRGFLNPSNSVFFEDRPSSKIKALLKLLKEKVAKEDKAIVISQWTSLLELIAIHVKNEGLAFDCLNGKIPVNKRMAIVDNFNDPHSKTRVLLLSLTAGGVGLNLIGANHLFLLDLHWNPQLESQAQDRIYRMGQNKSIFVYKFMATGTIEERIKALQDKKLDLANSMLTGSKQVINSKLSLQDLKMLFDFK